MEDDPNLSDSLSAYLQLQGYQVSSALRGEEAIQAIRRAPPNIVLLDIHLPDIDGYEVCRQLRLKQRTRLIPIIFLTEKRGREDKLTGLELGAVDYITKPFDFEELLLRVRNVLRRTQINTNKNPVTGLSVGTLVRERLQHLLQQPNWGIVLTSINGLDDFRDRYGFVAADDVSRAVSLMLSKTVEDAADQDDFIGHSDSGDFIILTTAARCVKLAEQCRVRLRSSVQYFYPTLERQKLEELPESQRISIQVASLSSAEHTDTDAASVIAALDSRLSL